MNSIDKNWVNEHIDSSGVVIIPDGVEKIEAEAFRNNKLTRKVIMPDSIVEIGKNAFAGCINLQYVKISNSLKLIEDGTFKDCTLLSAVELPDSLEKIGALCFARSGIEQIDLPKNLEKIGVLAFWNCEHLQRVGGGKNVSVIESGVFKGSNLVAFKMPDQTKDIVAGAFEQNSKLSSITLNENLDFLSERAFKNCDNIKEINIDGTKRIKYGAFMNKPSIRKINVNGQEFVLADNEKLFALQKLEEKVVIVVEDKKGVFSSKCINLEKGTCKVLEGNVYLTDNGKLCYAVKSLVNASIISLESLKKNGVNQLYIYGGDNEFMPSEHEKGFNFNLYNIDDLIQIKLKIEELKKQIKLPSEKDKDRQKKIYAQIVRALSESIEYDYWGAEESKEKYEKLTGKSYEDYMKRNEKRDRDIAYIEDRNLVGLIRGTTVCQGSAEIIRNLAAEFGIQAICVRGKDSNGGHAWNQVKLDGVWYDDDFTNYQNALARGKLDKCGAFLMGETNGISIAKYNKYEAYTVVNPVGKTCSAEEKNFLLSYGRVQQQDKSEFSDLQKVITGYSNYEEYQQACVKAEDEYKKSSDELDKKIEIAIKDR